MSDRLGLTSGCAPRNTSEKLTTAKGQQNHNSRQSGPRDVETVLGAFRNSNVFIGHLWTGHLFHELLLCARHWPTPEATKRYLGRSLSSESLHQGVRVPARAFRENDTCTGRERAEASAAEEVV